MASFMSQLLMIQRPNMLDIRGHQRLIGDSGSEFVFLLKCGLVTRILIGVCREEAGFIKNYDREVR